MKQTEGLCKRKGKRHNENVGKEWKKNKHEGEEIETRMKKKKSNLKY